LPLGHCFQLVPLKNMQRSPAQRFGQP
jgi:hypothetical protein